MKLVMETFCPDLRITKQGNDVTVLFDSMCLEDQTRAVRMIRIKDDFKVLSFALEGFQQKDLTETDSACILKGTINLTVNDKDEQTVSHVLASCSLSLARKSKKASGDQSVSHVENLIRNGVSEALHEALAYFLDTELWRETGSQVPSVQSGQIVPLSGDAFSGKKDIPQTINSFWGRRYKQQQTEQRGYRRRMMVAIILTPIIIAFIGWSMSALSKKRSPIEDAVARAMVQDPKSVQAQVELTKDTLRQMGLDPGTSGDMGCLAAPH